MEADTKLILREIEKVNQRMDVIHADLNNRMDAMNADLNNRINDLQDASIKIQLLIENDLCKRIDLIGEGHDFLKMRLDGALEMEKKRESMGLELTALRADMNKVKDKMGIA